MGIAYFEKVTYEQFVKDWGKQASLCGRSLEIFLRDVLPVEYESIKLPERKTVGSAGYDFFSPYGFTLEPDETITIPTGIRCRIDDGWVLKIYMRSGLGFKYGLRLINGTGIIDSDYYNSDNEGHIQIKLINDSSIRKTVKINAGDSIAQGIFIPFGLTVSDHASGVRNGGFGSTDMEDKTVDQE
ncbi:MAG: deoxyuridine 5'-triphosphate nucleotidohydrolase [Enterocloster asparagiformis]|nr:deoxyuridine 5'-triphosphate nucleotidohydrolase [Enterocloster asparagiformis]